jgi:hypothetical protein
LGSGGSEAPGLKLKDGRAARPTECKGDSESSEYDLEGISIADSGRRPARRDELGLPLGSGAAGKEKDGFGMGRPLGGWDGVKEAPRMSSGEPAV